MGLIARDGGGKAFDPVPEGTFNAVCYSVIDLGTRLDDGGGGKWVPKKKHEIQISWEIPSERILLEKNGQTVDLPRSVHKTYTLSLHEKAVLRKELQTWRGRAFTKEELSGFDIKNLLGKSCLLQIIHSKKGDITYANVSAVIAYPKGTEPLKLENPEKFYSLEDHRDVLPEGLPQWLIDKIKTSDEYKTFIPAEMAHAPTETGAVEDNSDVPF
jgi:hypothetical protein